MPLLDNTLTLLAEGYAWLPSLRRCTRGDVIHTRLMGQRAVALGGLDAARFFYDENHVQRGAAPRSI
jgi:fatty-acid peroxygenase